MEAKFMSAIQSKDEEIKSLRSEVVTLKESVDKLKDLVDESDAYERRDTLIFSGNTVPRAEPGENCFSTLQNLLKEKLSTEVATSELSVVHRLGPKPTNQREDRRPIIAKFCRRDTKSAVLVTGRRARTPNLFVNESLTPLRKNIFTTLRRMKKDHPDLVKGVTTFDGKIYAFTKPVSPSVARDQKHYIANKTQLVNFCRDHVKKPIDEFIGDLQL